MPSLLLWYLIAALLLTVPVVAVGMINLFAFRRPRAVVLAEEHLPFISILVPARDEERVIQRCLDSLLAQNYPQFEVIVLDDNSTDSTYDILCRMRDRDHRLRVLAGALLPDDWCGKPYACWQLANAASGDLILFTDADCVFAPDALLFAVGAMNQHHADLVSLAPDYVAKTFWEELLVTQLIFIPLFFAPMTMVNGPAFPLVAGANGSFLFLRRETYFEVDGHRAVRWQLSEDIKFAQLIKRHGKTLWYGDGINTYCVRMYESLGEIWTGFTRNLFPAFSNKLRYLIPVLIYLLIVFVAPVILGVYGLITGAPWTLLAFAPYIAIALLRLMYSISLRRGSLWYVLLDPLAWTMTMVIALGSVVKTRASGAEWKGRRYVNGKVQSKDR